MTYTVYVAYPNSPGSRFDMNYYNKKHMPLVYQKWSQHGLEHWSVTHFTDMSAPYQVQAILFFKDKASFEHASTKEGEEVFGDIPNYTDLKPTLYHGEEVAKQS